MQGNLSFLKILNEELIEARKRNPSFSLRAAARKLGVHVSALSEILNGRRQVTPKMARRILTRLSVDPAISEQVLAGINPPKRTLARASSDLGSPVPATPVRAFHQLSSDQFHVLADWFHFAVLSLAETQGFRDDPAWIARRLKIKKVEASLALERLERLGLLRRNAKGKLAATGVQVATTTDIADLSLRKSHAQNLELAQRSLDGDPVPVRDFSSITVATTPKKIAEAKKRITRFRRELSRFLESGEKNSVYQMNVQFFPLTSEDEGESQS